MMRSLLARPARLVGLAAVAVLVVGGMLALVTSPGIATNHEDPMTAPIPEYDYGDGARSFVAMVDLSTSPPTVGEVTVGLQRAYSHVGDPPELRLSIRDHTGAVRTEYDSFDTRKMFDTKPDGHEQRTPRSGPAAFVTAYDPDAEVMAVGDQVAGTELVEVDLAPAIRQHCTDHPTEEGCLQTDLAAKKSDAKGPKFAVIGEPVTFKVTTAVKNLGPETPVDGDVTVAAQPGKGLTATPADQTLVADGLVAGARASEVTGFFEVLCTKPGKQAIRFESVVQPSRGKIVDPNPDNDRVATKKVTVDCAVPVAVNAKPGSAKNRVGFKGTVDLAVLTTRAGEYGLPLDVDARKIKAKSVRVGERLPLMERNAGAPELHGRVHLERSYELDDTTKDKDSDGVLHVDARKVPVTKQTTELCVRGVFDQKHSYSFFGCDRAAAG